MAKREPSKLELDISKYISSNQLHHSKDPGFVGGGAHVRPRVAGGGGGGGGEREVWRGRNWNFITMRTWAFPFCMHIV
jgi:hypothetical protein